MLRKYYSWLFVLIVVALPITVFAIVNWYQHNLQRLPILGEKGQTIAPFKMTNQNGKTIGLADWDDKIIVANFFFTHCPSICPKMTKNLTTVQQYFAKDTSLLINSFTVDPERDSTERLSFYASQFNIKSNNWNLLTGEKRAIYLLARKSFMVVATDGDGGPNDFIHSDKLVLMDTQKRIRGFYDGIDENSIKQLIKDIVKLQKEDKER